MPLLGSNCHPNNFNLQLLQQSNRRNMSTRKRKLVLDENNSQDVPEPPNKKRKSPKENENENDTQELKTNCDSITTITSSTTSSTSSTINPLTNEAYSEDYFKLLSSRKKLPIWEQRKEFIELFIKSRVLVLVGETGSGKTTQIPQFLVDSGFASPSKMIGITQPRRVAAMSVARRVSQEMDVILGEQVGYNIRFEDMTSKKTILKYMTDGMLLREAQGDPTLSRYSVIILDEAHERTVSTDVLMGLLKELMTNNLQIKLLVMSATLDSIKFTKYFDKAPCLKVNCFLSLHQIIIIIITIINRYLVECILLKYFILKNQNVIILKLQYELFYKFIVQKDQVIY